MHRLAEILEAAGRGEPPPWDGQVDVLTSTGGAADAVVAFPGHLVIAAEVDPDEVAAHFPARDFGAWSASLAWLGRRAARSIVPQDVVLIAEADDSTCTEPRLHQAETAELSAPLRERVRQASRHRRDVRVFVTPDSDGVVIVGTGLAGRQEIALEVELRSRGRGVGRGLALAARQLVANRSLLWAQVHPANAASLRALGAAGFVPVCAEHLLVR